MSIALSFAAGIIFTAVCLTISAYYAQQGSAIVPRIPHRLLTLADHGQIAPRIAPRIAPARISVYTPLDHARQLIRHYVDDVGHWIVGSDKEFAEWWEETWTNERKRQYHGRRRLEEHEPAWRKRWSEYDTQSWPTLATSNFELLTQLSEPLEADWAKPMICFTTFNLDLYPPTICTAELEIKTLQPVG